MFWRRLARVFDECSNLMSEKNTNLKDIILDTLDSNKALDIISIDLKNKSSMADYMIIALSLIHI